MMIISSASIPKCIALITLIIASNDQQNKGLGLIVNASPQRLTGTFVAPIRHIAPKLKIHHEKQWNNNIILPKISGQLKKSKLSTLSSSTSGSHFAAGGTLLLSTVFGVLFNVKSNNSSGGHVVTLLTAAILSNLSQSWDRLPDVPSEHFLYDWCWSIFLPASLVFALLSSSSLPKTMTTDDGLDTTNSPTSSDVTKKCIQGMAIPFIMGSIGSVLGCMASFVSIPLPASSPLAARSTITSSAILAGCLCASYIGGTVNFFAAGKILTPISSSNDMGNIFGSMAAADLVVMALYFTMLSAASKSSWLQRLFPSRRKSTAPISNTNISSNTLPVISDDRGASLFNTIGATSIATLFALSSVFLSSRLEKSVNNHFGMPGTMCAFLAVFGLLYNKLIEAAVHFTYKQTHSKRRVMQTVCSHIFRTLQQIQFIGPTLCNLSFFLLFGAVGTTADVTSAILGGPMILIYALLALMVHSLILLSGTFVSSRMVKYSSSWEEVLTASNAAIGGPSTAAAFATSLVTTDRSSYYQKALVLSATMYGVLGYAVGTSVGVLLTRLLLLLSINK